jgi:hypothetical protein
MIPLKHINVLRCDGPMALLITLTFTTCDLGCVVQSPVPRYGPQPTLGAFVLNLASFLAVARYTHGHEPDSAVLSSTPHHLYLELSWRHVARCTDLHSEQKTEVG